MVKSEHFVFKYRLMFMLAVFTLLTISGAGQLSASEKKPGSVVPPYRGAEAAVIEEYEAANSADTQEAFILFIRPHPDHDLADEARQILKQKYNVVLQ